MNDKDLNVMFSSKSDEWSTPQSFFDELDKEFHFNLDVCSTDKNHKCDNYFTKSNDGLTKNWGGTECFVTRHIVKFLNGLRNRLEKQGMIIHLLFC